MAVHHHWCAATAAQVPEMKVIPGHSFHPVPGRTKPYRAGFIPPRQACVSARLLLGRCHVDEGNRLLATRVGRHLAVPALDGAELDQGGVVGQRLRLTLDRGGTRQRLLRDLVCLGVRRKQAGARTGPLSTTSSRVGVESKLVTSTERCFWVLLSVLEHSVIRDSLKHRIQ